MMDISANKFFRRRQFILGPSFIDYDGWNHIRFDYEHCITVHPDLPITVSEGNETKAILLGYFIDSTSPDLDDTTILQRFTESPFLLSTIVSNLEPLTGRFVLLLRSRDKLWLFHDACGLRQVNYCKDERGAIWCASQPESLAEILGYQYDPYVISFRNLPAFQKDLEDFALVGERTPYREVKYLLANHFLDILSGTAHRYWPEPDSFGSISIKESIPLYCETLENSIKAAAARFDLKSGISAGSDSRKTLAAARAVKDKISFFTEPPEERDRRDLIIPSRLLPRLGVKHHILKINQMPKDFRQYYECSATWAREKQGHIAYSSLIYFGTDATVLNSNLSEYSQVWYWLPNSRINGEGLAILKGLNDQTAVNDFQDWIDDARPLCNQSHMNILVLFQLELRSRWVANTFAEYDIAYESFNPYNNRRIFQIELSVNERHRRGHRLDIPLKQTKHMWPDVLKEPINPEESFLKKLRYFILRKIVHRTITPWCPVVEYFKYLKLRSYYRRERSSH